MKKTDNGNGNNGQLTADDNNNNKMQLDPSIVFGQLLFWILNICIENDDIFVTLSPLGLHPATEVENS